MAEDLLDTYYSIVHIRFPILDPDEFRARFNEPDSGEGPIYHPLLAVALAWGARFSDHPMIAADRDEMSTRRGGQEGPERSRLVQLMIIRAREVAEVNKAFRIANLDNVRLAILMESLLARESEFKIGGRPISYLSLVDHADPYRGAFPQRQYVCVYLTKFPSGPERHSS